MRLGAVIAAYRKAKGIRLIDLARQIGVTKSVLHRIEQGQDCSATALRAVLTWLLAESLT